ncbi:hypothetical protein RB598_008985 [Gaeumannomyces tritici]
MEVPGFVIGTSGLIAVAQLCLDIARAIDGIRAFKEDSASLYAVYNFEQVRLALWLAHVVGVTQPSPAVDSEALRRMEITESQMPVVLTSGSPINLHEPLRNALTEVARILGKLNKLLTKYETAGAGDAPVMTRIKFQTRLFKEGGRDEIKALLGQLKMWNDSLDGVVESRMRHHLAATMHVRLLAAARTDEQLEVVQGAARETHPVLGQEAAFRRELLGIECRGDGGGQQSSGLSVSLDHLSPGSPPAALKDGSLRCMGRLSRPGQPAIRILQEWKLGQPNWGDLERTTATARADQLASILRLETKPSRLRCLDLAAYALRDGPRGRLDFCFLYRPPRFADGSSSPPTTLHAALSLSERRRPSLAQRFRVAATLSGSVLALHGAGWLHKAVCGANVLFFADAQTERPDFSQPFVAGFEFARPDTVRDLTLEGGPGGGDGSGSGGGFFAPYCHPELVASLAGGAAAGGGRRRYQRRFDIYGLGVVLLEIGCWMSAATILASRRRGGQDSDSASAHEHLMRTAAEALPSRVGTRYKQAVCACLIWEADTEGEDGEARQRQIEEFADRVVGVLGECHCSF